MDYLSKVKELRKRIPIPITEAMELLKKNNGDIVLCEQIFIDSNILEIRRQTNCSEEMARQRYREHQFDIAKTIGIIRKELYDKNESISDPENYKDALSKLDFSDISFEDMPVEVGDKVNNIILKFGEFRDEIINSLPENVKTIYLVGEFESAILCDGLLPIFYNNNLSEIMRFRTAVEKTGSKKLLNLFDEAKSLVEEKYILKSDINFVDEFPDKDPFKFFGNKLNNKIEKIVEKIDDLQSSGEYWDRIELLFNRN